MSVFLKPRQSRFDKKRHAAVVPLERRIQSMRSKVAIVLVLTLLAGSASAFAAEGEPPASPEVTAALKPYMDGYKLAGYIAIVADKNGKTHYRNVLGYADVAAKKPIGED